MATKGTYDIEDAIERIEEILLESMRRNLSRHIDIEAREGLSYAQWQAEQLYSLHEFSVYITRKTGGFLPRVLNGIDDVLREAYRYGEAAQEASILEAIKHGATLVRATPQMAAQFLKVNQQKLETLIHAVQHDMTEATTALLRTTNDIYRKVIFQSQVYYESGSGTLAQAVDMASKDFLSNGIPCIQYKNGAKVTIDSYSRMSLRTANVRASIQGEAAKRDEWGHNLVIVNYRGVACPQCLPWVGKILYDDVYQSTPVTDDKYPRLSEAIDAGLFHPNCRDTITAYFPDTNEPPRKMTAAEKENAARVYELEQKQRGLERKIRKYKREKALVIDETNQKAANQKLRAAQKQMRDFLGEHPELRRRPDREKVYVNQ